MTEPRHRRKHTWMINGATVFVTTVFAGRNRVLADPVNMALLRTVLHAAQEIHPFRMIAYAYMPDHIHLLMRLGPDVQVSELMQSLKRNYTIEYKKLYHIKRKIQVWQPEFLEHTIRDEDDFYWHIGYCHRNPLKHGLATEYGEYPYTSWQAYQDRR